jgi:hypothetical protein
METGAHGAPGACAAGRVGRERASGRGNVTIPRKSPLNGTSTGLSHLWFSLPYAAYWRVRKMGLHQSQGSEGLGYVKWSLSVT